MNIKSEWLNAMDMAASKYVNLQSTAKEYADELQRIAEQYPEMTKPLSQGAAIAALEQLRKAGPINEHDLRIALRKLED